MRSREIRPAELWISFLGEVGEDVAVDVEAAEEGKEEMEENAEDGKYIFGNFLIFVQ